MWRYSITLQISGIEIMCLVRLHMECQTRMSMGMNVCLCKQHMCRLLRIYVLEHT